MSPPPVRPKLPPWLHLATVGYFATNIAIAAMVCDLAQSPWVIGLALWGIIGGLIEHVSPYFPRLYLGLRAEQLLFRLPTIAAFFGGLVELGASWWLFAIVLVVAVNFIREPPLDSLEPRFHLVHFLTVHLAATLVVTALWATATGRIVLPGLLASVSA